MWKIGSNIQRKKFFNFNKVNFKFSYKQSSSLTPPPPPPPSSSSNLPLDKSKNEQLEKNAKTEKFFGRLGVCVELIYRLQELSIYKPTPIQHLAIPKLLQTHSNFLLTSQTGTGKTLSYLIPIIQKLKIEEIQKELLKLEESKENSEVISEINCEKNVLNILSEDDNSNINIKEKNNDNNDNNNKEITLNEIKEIKEQNNNENINKKENNIENNIENTENNIENNNGEKVENKKKKRTKKIKIKKTKKEERTDIKRPRAIVLVPNRELATQILNVSHSLSKFIKLRTSQITGGRKTGQIRFLKRFPLDIIVTTPTRFLFHTSNKRMYYSKLRYLVVDEADTIMDSNGGFLEEMKTIFHHIKTQRKTQGKEVQTMFISATSGDFVDNIKRQFPEINILQEQKTNKVVSLVRHEFKRINRHNGEDKLPILLEYIKRELKEGNQIIVFCKNAKSCRAIDYFLNENNYQTASLHGEMTARMREDMWSKFEEKEVKILVGSDIVSRGLDTLSVDTVINFDFAYTGVDYIHRAGRTGRAGSMGKVISLISKKEQPIADVIENSLKKGETVEKWNSQNAWTNYLSQKIRKKILDKKKSHLRPLPQIQRIRKQRAKENQKKAQEETFSDKYLLK